MPSTFAQVLNDFRTTLAAAHTAGAGTLVLQAGDGTRLGALAANRVYRLVAVSNPDTASEAILGIFESTGRTTDTLTGVTAAEGTTDAALAVGTTLDVRMTAKDLSEVQTAVNALESSAGASYSANVGNGTATDVVVAHNLGTQDVDVTVRAAATPYGSALVAWDATSTNSITLHFTAAPATNQYRVTIQAGGVAGGGGGSGANALGTYVVQTATNAPANAQVLASLATGLVLVTTGTGVLSTAVAGTDYVVPSGSITGTAANVTGTVAVANGGTGQAAFTDGQLLIGNTATGGLTPATLTAGANVTVTNAGGAITIAATGGNTFATASFTGGTSGTTALQAQAVAGGTVSLPAATSVVASVLATTTASVTQSTKNTTATVLGAATGAGPTLPANFFVAGRTLRLKVHGTITTTATSAAALTFLMKLGATTVATTAAYTPTAAATSVGWSAEVVVTCRTAGASGTVMAQGRVELLPTTAPVVLGMANTATQTINTTATLAVDFQVTESNATGAQTVTATNYTLEVIN